MSHRAYLSQVLRVAAFLSLAAVCSAQDSSGHKPELELMTIENSFDGAIFSPDGKRLVGSASGNSWRATVVRFWDISTGDAVPALKGHGDRIWKIYFSPDGKRRITHENYTIKILNLETRKEIRSFATPAFTRCVAFVSDGKLLAGGHDDSVIRLWDVETSRLVRTLEGHTDWVTSLALSPDGKRLASASFDLTAKVWDLETGKEINRFEGHEWYLSSVAFGPKGKRLVTGSDDMTGRVWDLESGKQLFTLRGHIDWVRRVAYSPDGKWIVTGSKDKTAKVWNAGTGELVRTLEGHAKDVSGVAFSPDGERLATASPGATIKIWDVRSFVRGE
ncbi:MAG: WD40 repeat domain-containing protein [Pirellulaceae bacterium]|nr:WD40 repeat domain-containing protein [Pirellulaceae bacterium]HJN13004.1 WD40 repeat domain-containing protein [Pirellulaceae bacterium]